MANDFKLLNEAYEEAKSGWKFGTKKPRSGKPTPRRGTSSTIDTPDKEGYYKGVETTWHGDEYHPHVQMHYDAFRSPQFKIMVTHGWEPYSKGMRANKETVFTTDDPSEAKSYLRKKFNIRWDDSGHIRRIPVDKKAFNY